MIIRLYHQRHRRQKIKSIRVASNSNRANIFNQFVCKHSIFEHLIIPIGVAVAHIKSFNKKTIRFNWWCIQYIRDLAQLRLTDHSNVNKLVATWKNTSFGHIIWWHLITRGGCIRTFEVDFKDIGITKARISAKINNSSCTRSKTKSHHWWTWMQTQFKDVGVSKLSNFHFCIFRKIKSCEIRDIIRRSFVHSLYKVDREQWFIPAS